MQRRALIVAVALVLMFVFMFSGSGSDSADLADSALHRVQVVEAELQAVRKNYTKLLHTIDALNKQWQLQHRTDRPDREPVAPTIVQKSHESVCSAAPAFQASPRTSMCSSEEQNHAHVLDTKKRYVGDRELASISAYQPKDGVFLWDYFPPTVNCPNRERVGRLGDGGKFICDMQSLIKKDKCVIYSFGIDSEVSFELELLLRTKCEIWAYDFTIPNFPQRDKHEGVLAPSLSHRIHFFRLGLGHDGSDNRLLTLSEAMRRNGHTHIDLLKVDVEGAEWNVFAQWASEFGDQGIPVDQFSTELHFNDNMPTLFRAFDQLECLGLSPFMCEVNHNPCTWGGKPFAIEYTFVRRAQLPCNYDAEFAEDVYQRAVTKRGHFLKNVVGSKDRIEPWDGTREIYIWDWFPPHFNCPGTQLVGGLGRGSWFVCNYAALTVKEDCIVYSFGVQSDAQFESSLLEDTKCKVFTFDTSPHGLSHERLSHQSWNLAAWGDEEHSDAKSITAVMQHFGHTHVDIVKVSENWKKLMNVPSEQIPVGQLLVTVEYDNTHDLFRLFEGLEGIQFRPFAWQLDHGPCAVQRRRPSISDYSLVNRNDPLGVLGK